MSFATTPVRRHALGLPAGSVRAAHVLGVVALVCAIILIPSSKGPIAIPPYLVYLVFLMVGHFFAAHGVTIATRDDPNASPLYLPGGLVRVLIVAALAGTIGWKIYNDQAGLRSQFEASVDALKKETFLPVVILGGFFLGVVLRTLVGRTKPPVALQDFEAWISLIALVAIFSAGIIHLLIDPNLHVEERLYLPTWEGFVGGIIAFYFGERS